MCESFMLKKNSIDESRPIPARSKRDKAYVEESSMHRVAKQVLRLLEPSSNEKSGGK